MSHAEIIRALREIGSTAGKGKRACMRGADYRVLLQYLLSIQATAQTAMQGLEGDAEQQAVDTPPHDFIGPLGYTHWNVVRKTGEPT